MISISGKELDSILDITQEIFPGDFEIDLSNNLPAPWLTCFLSSSENHIEKRLEWHRRIDAILPNVMLSLVYEGKECLVV